MTSLFTTKATPAARPQALARWLLAVAALVFAMVVVGGITRLTESGLSITQWKPVTGAIPPLDQAQWLREFDLYRHSSQYVLMNQGMTLAAFKNIYFWEYGHRLLGRLVGIAFAVPLIWFAWRRAIPGGYGPRLLALLALGGLQGAIGWWMVASGLVDRTSVSHYRLAVHLITALFIIAGLIWTALDLRVLARDTRARPSRLRLCAAGAALVLMLQLTWGAYVAGLDAGYVASDWPLMNGHFYPAGVIWSAGMLATLNSDPFLVHFLHRWWAWVTAAALILLARAAKRRGARRAAIALNAAVGAQILIGISTVLSGIALPLAVLHQATGALLVVATTFAAHAVGRPSLNRPKAIR